MQLGCSYGWDVTIEKTADASSLRPGGESAADVFQELGAWEGE
jgi:hypothetical protein